LAVQFLGAVLFHLEFQAERFGLPLDSLEVVDTHAPTQHQDEVEQQTTAERAVQRAREIQPSHGSLLVKR